MALQKFYVSGDVYLSKDEAWKTLVWFFGGNSGISVSNITWNDRSFAQALIFEAVYASRKISFVQKVWESSVNPPDTVKKFFKEIVKITAKTLWENLKPVDLEDPTIYKMVKDTLTINWRSPWQTRVDTGSPVY